MLVKAEIRTPEDIALDQEEMQYYTEREYKNVHSLDAVQEAIQMEFPDVVEYSLTVVINPE